MKNIFLFFLTISGLSTQAQTLDRRYTENIYFGASKEDLIDVVIKKVKDYYMNDVGGIIKKMKKRGLKLAKPEKRVEFLTQMEADMRKKLKAADDWESAEIESFNQRYLISISQLLARDFFFIGVGKPNTGYNGDGFVTLMFDKNGLSGFSARMATVKDYKYNIDNRHPYNNFTLGELSRVIRSDLGDLPIEEACRARTCAVELMQNPFIMKYLI